MVKDIFLAYIAIKKKLEKWPFLDQNQTLWKNVNFWTFWSSCFYSQKARFFDLEYLKRNFCGLYCIKEKVGKMAIFGPKPWVNSFGKMSIFLTFWTSCFYNLESRFFVLEYRKTHFAGLYCLIKKLEKWQFLDQNHGLTPLEKCQFLEFITFLSLYARKAFLCSRIS